MLQYRITYHIDIKIKTAEYAICRQFYKCIMISSIRLLIKSSLFSIASNIFISDLKILSSTSFKEGEPPESITSKFPFSLRNGLIGFSDLDLEWMILAFLGIQCVLTNANIDTNISGSCMIAYPKTTTYVSTSAINSMKVS